MTLKCWAKIIPVQWHRGLSRVAATAAICAAGVSAQSPNQQAARELIKLLKSPEAKPMIKAKGNDPA